MLYAICYMLYAICYMLCHETVYTKPSFRNTALLATLPVYLFIYAFVHLCPLSVYACFAPSYMPGSHSHIPLFSIATHHALWFSVAIIAPDSIALTPPPTTLITDPSTSLTSNPLSTASSISARPSSFLLRPFPIPRRLLQRLVIITLFNSTALVSQYELFHRTCQS